MKSDTGPILDMKPNGEFIRARDYRTRDYSRRGYHAPKPSFLLIVTRLLGLIALIGVAILAFWFAVFALPFVFLCGIVLYGIFRYKVSSFNKRHRPVSTHHGAMHQNHSWRDR